MAVVATTDPQPITPPATPAPLTAAPQDCSAVNSYDWNRQIAYAICMAESGGNTQATGHNGDGSIDRGLMQVNSIHADMVQGDLQALYTPAVNVKIAYSLSHDGTDWTAWSTYNNGKYRQFL